MGSSVETLEFQAETRQLLQLVIHSIYSNKDIFLRELISNASDALDKLRLESLTDSDLKVDTSDLHIALEVEQDARTLTVRDNGAGMSRDDVVELIGTIAKSGTASLLESLKEAKDPAAAQSLIGQFGVGFYSAFMVADKVILRTRRAGTDSGTLWESDGEGTYQIRDEDGLPVGTSVTVRLKPTDSEDGLADYLAEWKIRQIVKQYSDFIRWPIRMATERTDTDGNTTHDVETLNSMKALWARPRSEVTEAEYSEFYKQISHDWLDPARTIHMRAEGTFEYEALLFIPSQAPFDLFSREARRGIQLYVKRVFIMDDCDALMPDYLRFVKGVVDAHDLSLNISREILQHDRQIHGVRRRLVKKVLGALKDMQAGDAEGYAKLWAQFGRALKEGLIENRDNTEALLELVSAASTQDPEKPTTLREYVERMKEGQDAIYYLTGESRAMVENSPHMEAFAAKGYEVLILTDPVDEVWTDQVGTFDGHRLQSVAKGQVDLDEPTGSGDEEAGAEKEKREQDFAALLPWLTTTLSEHVKQVRLSSRLTTSAACIVGDVHDMTPTLEKMYRATGQQMPPVKRILELNPAHPLITALRSAHEANPDDPVLTETAELVYGSALLAEGGDLPDAARFTRLLTDRLTRTL